MKAQRDELLKILPDHGWRVVEIEVPNRERWHRDWADEIITIESSWSPVGFRAYIFFLVDPQAGRERRKGEQVWAVRASVKFNNSGEFPDFGNESDEFPVGKGHWKESLKELLATLAKFRQAAVNETSSEKSA